MVTIHVAKFDCFHSSRVMMQSKWDNNSFFIQKSKSSNYTNTTLLTLNNVITAANKLGPNDKMIFHSQSSLIYLIVVIFFSNTNVNRLIYDIHDLNIIENKWNYKKIRSLIMYFFEYLILNFFQIKSMIVSKGLSIILEKRYKIKRPVVVRNISTKFPKNLKKRRIKLKKGVYFGTFDRLNNSFFEKLYNENFKIDIYGRFNSKKNLDKINKAVKDGVVNYCGEYSSSNMNFLQNYDFLYYNVPIYDINYRFAAPNKFFQALVHGLTIFTPTGYSELTYLLNSQPGFHYNFLESISKSLKQYSGDDYKNNQNISKFLVNILLESKNNYKFLINNYL